MAQHYIGFNRGLEGAKPSDFTTGTSTGNTDMEFRYDDTKNLTRKDLMLFLEAVERFVESQLLMKIVGAAPDL